MHKIVQVLSVVRKGGEVGMNTWRLRPITDKQKKCIDEMLEYSPYPLQKFEGQTRGEASDYIDKYGKLGRTIDVW